MTDPNRAPILVAGAHRTGTTWVGKMLAAAPGVAYISEPLNALHRPGVLRAPTPYWYQYIDERNEAAYLPAFRQLLAFRYHLFAELAALRSIHDAGRMGRDLGVFLRGRLLGCRPLLKDPFAVFSAPWFARRLGCQVVITIRHPAGFASSLKRLDWPFDFTDLLAQPLLMDTLSQAGLDACRPEMEALAAAFKSAPDILAQAALLWRLVYSVVAQAQAGLPGLHVVRHEDLSVDPLAGYQALY
ncbi:MAG: sulfotransferase, partial [Chloroflexota bacterium]